MKKSIIAILAVSLISSQAMAMTVGIRNFDGALAAVRDGADVKAVIDFTKCELKSNPDKKVKILAGINFNVFNYYEIDTEKGKQFTLATSNALLIDTDKFGPVKNYVRLRLFADNTAELHSAYYDPKTYVVKHESDYTCKISNGYDDNAIRLYEDRV